MHLKRTKERRFAAKTMMERLVHKISILQRIMLSFQGKRSEKTSMAEVIINLCA